MIQSILPQNYYNRPIMQPCIPQVNAQPIQQPDKNGLYPLTYPNIYAQKLVEILNKNSNLTMSEFYDKYFPDLTSDERVLSEENLKEVLYKRGKFLQLAKYGSYNNCENIYNKCKDDENFKELNNSKFFNSAQGFVFLVNTMNNLDIQRTQKLNEKPVEGYYLPCRIQGLPYPQYDTKDYLRMLNDFTKNAYISDDLKYYFIAHDSYKLDNYYTKLDKLKNSPDDINILISSNIYN